ncbi:MAG: hypothetical protein JKX80_01905 [Candidatus Pacebacteria bacterium]|nr:hypothetical protein [Candidatus Paceibacterota bacterium]
MTKISFLTVFWLAITLLFTVSVSVAYAETEAERKSRLEAELSKIEGEIKVQQVLLDSKSGERRSLERDVALLDGAINQAQLGIRQRNLTIAQIASDVEDRNLAVQALDEKMLREKASLSKLIRKTNEIDELSFAEMILGSNDLSTIFSDLDSFEVVKISLSNSFELIADTRGAIQSQKYALQDEQVEEQELRQLQVIEKRQVESRKDEKDGILTVTKGQEKIYQKLIKEKEKSAAEIRSTLFALRGTAAIPFGDAYDFAKRASVSTGVRPALILAILKQGSELGENVGSCNRPGDPPEKAWDRIMPGPLHYANYVANGNSCRGANSPCSWRDDQSIFKKITAKLGLDHRVTPLSCPIGGNIGGWGGAMGPSQFIPSTWQSYEKKIASIVGVGTASPWNPQHAITGTALLMADNGADKGTRDSERLAALRYFAGWGNANKPVYAFYGNSVMRLVGDFEDLIAVLER